MNKSNSCQFGDLKKLVEDTMQRINAWRVSQNIVERIDGEPGPAGDCTVVFVISAKEDQFLFKSKYFQAYNSSKSAKTRDKVPGHSYLSNLIASAKKLSKVVKRTMSTGIGLMTLFYELHSPFLIEEICQSCTICLQVKLQSHKLME